MNAVERYAAQGPLQPGDEGFWQVWGARAQDILPGDVLMVRWEHDDGSHEIGEYEVIEVAPWGAVGITVTTTTGTIHVGHLQRIALVRWGTHNTLAGSI